jgi:hypothetical protein
MSNLLQIRQGLNPPSNPTGQGSAGLFESQEIVPIKTISNLQYGSFQQAVSVSKLNVFDWFDLLPVVTTVTATTDKWVLLIGSNTPVAAQSTTGGLLLSTGATSGNQAGIAGIAATGTAVPITATNNIIFRSRVQLPSLTTCFFSMGLNSTVTNVNPITDGAEGASFLADPTNSLTASTGATAAQALNWILVNSVATVVTYTFTNVPIIAAVDYQLDLVLNPNLTWSYFINGVLVATPAAVATLNTVVKVIGGVDTTANTVATAIIRFYQLERSIG